MANRFRLFTLTFFATILATIPVFSLAASAKKPILEMIPTEVTGFAVLSDLPQADKAIATLSAKTQLPIPGPVMILKMATNFGDVIDTEGSLAVLFFTTKPDLEKLARKESIDATPTTTVFLFSVSDFSKLLATFKEPEKVDGEIYKVKVGTSEMFLTSKDGYALLAAEDSRESLDLVLRTKTGMTETLRPWKDWVDQQVVYGFLTHDGVEAYSAQYIAAMMHNAGPDEIPEGDFEDFEEDDAESTSLQAEDTATNPKEAEKSADIILDGIDFVAAGAKVDESGIVRVTGRTAIKSDTKLSKNFEEWKPFADNSLASFPSETFTFAGGGSFPDGLKQCFQDWQKENADLSEAWSLEDGFLFYDNYRVCLQGESFFFAPPEEGQSLLEGIQILSWVKDPEQAFEAIKKDFKQVQSGFERSFGSFMEAAHLGNQFSGDSEDEDESDAKKEKISTLCNIYAKEIAIEGCKTLVVTYDLSKVLKKLQESPIGAQISQPLERVYGKDFKMIEYNVQVDKNRILTAYYADLEKLKQCIEIAKNQNGGLADGKEVKEILAMLPPDAQCTFLWSPYGTSKHINWYFAELMGSILQGMSPFGELPKFQKSPPVGIASVASENLLEATIVIPPDTLRNSIQYGMQVQALLQSIQGNLQQ